MIKQFRPGVTLFLVGVLAGMVILLFCRLVVSEIAALIALLILAALWILPAWLGKGRKALKRSLPRIGKTTKRRRAARK